MNTLRPRWHWSLRPLFGCAILFGLAIFYGGQPTRAVNRHGTLRLAYFPNLTHAPALVGVAQGEFQKALGEVGLDTKVFNAGPEAMEALLAGAIDVAYVGPSPAINTYLKSKGKALRIVAGVCEGGAALVARKEAGITALRDLNGKRVTVPQLGGTQDISLRTFLAKEGLKAQEKGGSVQVLPIKTADTLSLFKRGQIDAAWVPEPWVTRLIHEADASIVVDERDLWPGRRFATTVIVARREFLEKHPEQVEALLRGHLASLAFVQQHPEEARKAANSELKRLTGKALPEAVLQEAWGRVAFTAEPHRASIESFARMAADTGYLSGTIDVAALVEPKPLERAQQRGIARKP